MSSSWYDKRFKSGNRVSRWMHEVAPKKLTVRRDLSFWAQEPMLPVTQTPFLEIDLLPPSMMLPLNIDKIAKSANAQEVIEFDEFANRAYTEMVKYVMLNWKPDKFHLVLHSSGNDSILLSTVIKHIYEESGDDWLGETLFVELEGEGESFRQIMDIQGWKNIAVYNEGTDPVEHNWRVLDFKTAWHRANGSAMIPHNIWQTSTDWLREEGEIPDSVQMWTGYGANFVKNWAQRNNMLECIGRRYYSAYSSIIGNDDFYTPYFDLEFMRIGLKYGKPFGDYRRALADRLAPELADIERMDWGAKWQNYRLLSDEQAEQAMSDYAASWYGKEVRPDVEPPDQTMFREFWTYWTLASFCEWLMKNGHEVKAE